MVDATPTADPRESGADTSYPQLDVYMDLKDNPETQAKLFWLLSDRLSLSARLSESEAALSTQQAEVERMRLAGKDAALALDHAVAILDRLGISAEKVFEIARDNMLFALTPSPKDASDAERMLSRLFYNSERKHF